MNDAPTPSNADARCRIPSQTGYGYALLGDPPPDTIASRCGSRTGNARRTSVSTSEKIAVLAPMPSASDRTAIAVTTGVAHSERIASFRSCTRGFYARPAMITTGTDVQGREYTGRTLTIQTRGP